MYPSKEVLGEREFQVALLIGLGKNQQEICEELNMSTNTFKSTRERVQEKLGVNGTSEITRWCMGAGLIEAYEVET